MTNTFNTLALLANAENLLPEHAVIVNQLIDVFRKHQAKNELLSKYYNGKITAADVNLGLAVPKNLENLSISCSWPKKAVTALQERSRFDCFQCFDQTIKKEFDQIIMDSDLVSAYGRAVKSELTHGVVFGVVNIDDDERARIRFHTASSSAAIWDGEKNRIQAGFAICDQAKYNNERTYKPSLCCVYLDDYTIVLRRDSINTTKWYAEYVINPMGRPLMEPMVYNATFEKPFGDSRITPAVMHLTDSYLRSALRMETSAELYTSPQKYLIGCDENLMEEVQQNQFSAYVTSLLTIGKGENGETPTFGQIAAQSMAPHIEVMRSLAANFSCATNVPLSELGVLHDNPSSSEALQAMKEPLIIECESLNRSNAIALKNLALMAYAVNNDMAFNDIPTECKQIVPHFLSAAFPSIVSMADALTKIGSQDTSLPGTDAYYEMMGFDNFTIRTIREQEKQTATDGVLNQILSAVTVEEVDNVKTIT